MELRIFTEPQEGATYDDLLAVATRAERLGFGAFFRSDHYRGISHPGRLPGPTDAWITLAGLARDTTTIRLGTLVTSATFRLPGPLAIAVAGVDQMSGGRVELGLGAGWYDDEHHNYGIPFPPLGERFERLEEQLDVIRGLWATPEGGTFSHDGPHYRLVDGPALPKPTQRPGPPIIIGGFGPRRTPRLAARHADEFNVPFGDPGTAATANAAVDAACEAAGRDPSTVIRSVAQTVCCGADDAEVARRAAAIDRDPDELRAAQLGGTPDQVLSRLAEFAAIGITRVYLQVLDLADLDHLDLLAERVLPAAGDLGAAG